MSPIKCCLCFQPSYQFPEYSKTVLTDFIQLFNKIQSFGLQRIKADKLVLCKSCWICVMQVHQFAHDLRLKKETCDAKKSFLSSKIRRTQRSVDESGNNVDSWEDFQVESSPSNENEDNAEDLQVNGPTQDDENQPQTGNEESNPTMWNSSMATTEDNPRCSPQMSPDRMSLKDTADSDTESIELYEITDVITPPTGSLSIAPSLAEEKLAEATLEDTNESHSDSETAKRKTLVGSVSTSASSPDEQLAESSSDDTKEPSDSESEPEKSEEDPTEVMSVDTSDSGSDSESEPEKNRRVTSRSKRLPKNTKRSGWRIRASNVKRLSETDFTYLQKYPFTRTDVGFKCGLCSAISNFCKGSSRIEYNILKHIHEWHIGNNRARSNKIMQRFIEIAPNQFQYGKYKVELVDGNYRCEECGELRAAKARGRKAPHARILQHIIRHHEDPSRTYVCEQCGKVYKTSCGLSEHKQTKHENPGGQFPCSECGKTYPSRARATMHQKFVHGVKKKLICEICGKECGQKAALQSHIAFVHDGQMIKCDLCDKMFGSKFALGIHRHCHLGTKFVCDICGMEFSQQCSIKRHKRTAHNK